MVWFWRLTMLVFLCMTCTHLLVSFPWERDWSDVSDFVDLHEMRNDANKVSAQTDRVKMQRNCLKLLIGNESYCEVNHETELWQIGESDGSMEPFCLPWNVSSDAWWTHHTEWEVFHEDSTRYCFRIVQDAAKRQFLRSMYHRQFQSSCQAVVTKPIWSSGFGADLSNVVDGLVHGAFLGQPFQIEHGPWHYASPKPFDKATAACETQDMFCYFLPLSNCQPSNDVVNKMWHSQYSGGKGLFLEEPNKWYLEYATRPQTWLRNKIYQFATQQNMKQPCTVMHVRRGDVVLHGRTSRRYHAISEYLQAAVSADHKVEDNILLLTDDHNAIGEALSQFPQKNWMYINRTRHRAYAGGWEQQLPSKDPVFEMTVLLSTFRMVQRCNSILKSSSNFGGYLHGELLKGNKTAWSVDVEDGQDHPVHSALNIQTKSISKPYL